MDKFGQFVFDKYRSDREDKEKYHNLPRRDDGTIQGKFIPNGSELKQITRYELEEAEEIAFKMFKSNVEAAEKQLDSSKRKLARFERALINQVDEDAIVTNKRCSLSPINKCCVCVDENGDEICIFCKEKI